jgi:type I restriction enzyme S subunit
MSFPRYENYKDSGVEWLGEVPAHWKIASFCSVAAEREEPNTGMVEENLLSLSYGRIVQKDINSNDGLLPESFETYQIVRPGDIIFRLTDLQNDKRSLRTAIVEDTGIITFAYVAAKPINIESGYLSRLLRAYDITKVFYSMGGGLRQSMKFSDLKRLPTLLPPREEQSAIATFLDRETAKIDALVAEQQRLIELLKEKRQAVISHAVTKGLNPDVPMKDSGIEWLGEVPEHWDRLQLGKICIQVSDGPHFSPRYVEDGVLFLSARNIRIDGWLLDDAKFISEEDYLDFGRRVVPEKGDILYTKGGTTGIARVVDLDERFQIWVHVAVLKIDKRSANPYFIAYTLNSAGCYEQSQLHTRGATNKDLGLTRLTQIWFALPPLAEQFAIINFLDEETRKLDALTAEAQRAINLLQERRTALISAAVTGKIDVGGLMAAPPEKEAVT